MAVTTAVDLATALGVDDAARLHVVCTALVDRYAPGAPDDVKSEALVRAAGWLHGHTPAASAVGSVKAGEDVDVRFRNPAASALRASGAAALLSTWRVRRAVRAEAVTS